MKNLQDKKVKAEKDKRKQYTLTEWQALTVDKRLEIVARALGLIK